MQSLMERENLRWMFFSIGAVINNSITIKNNSFIKAGSIAK